MSAKANKGGWLATGKAAKQVADEAEKQQQDRRDGIYMPYRFWLPKGESCDIILLDDVFVSEDEEANSAVLIKEHNLQDAAGKYGNFVSCCSGIGPCPLCAKHGEGYHVFLLSAIVLRSFKTRKGEEREYSKMLFPVKLSQKDKFIDLQEANGGSIRGMRLTMKRGTGDQSVSTGEPVARKGGRLFHIVDEETLQSWFGNDKMVDPKTKKVLKEEDADLIPFDYEELFPAPDPEEWAEKYGDGPIAGSRQSNRKMMDDDDDAPPVSRPRGQSRFNDDVPDEEPALPTRGRGRAAKPDADADADDIPMKHDSDPDPAPVSRRRQAAKEEPAPAPVKRSRKF